MENKVRLHLFQAFGVEMEYMIVDRDTLQVKPVADELIKLMTGEYSEDFENGDITWSNELVLHVIELKCTRPMKDLQEMEKKFMKNVELVNEKLKQFNARLMPTAAHPWMNPKVDTFLWPHGNSEVYERYNHIFNCKGHGWSNLQSVHLNLPFQDDEEFAKLHAAIRLILPILPALTASSPILDGVETGFLDKRLIYYEQNQKKIKSLTGRVIPESVHSKRLYNKLIFDKIKKDISPYNADGILNPIWMNSRGAIARFDRGSIEIRVLDLQECPHADFARLALIIAVIKMLVEEQSVDFQSQLNWNGDQLYSIWQQAVKYGDEFTLDNEEYVFALTGERTKIGARELWQKLLDLSVELYPIDMRPWNEVLKQFLKKGCLSSRILKAVDQVYTTDNLKMIYRELCDSLDQNKPFFP